MWEVMLWPKQWEPEITLVYQRVHSLDSDSPRPRCSGRSRRVRAGMGKTTQDTKGAQKRPQPILELQGGLLREGILWNEFLVRILDSGE